VLEAGLKDLQRLACALARRNGCQPWHERGLEGILPSLLPEMGTVIQWAEGEVSMPPCKVHRVLFTKYCTGLLENLSFLRRKMLSCPENLLFKLVYLGNIPACHSGIHWFSFFLFLSYHQCLVL